MTTFIAAAREGDLAGLEKLLAADATWWSDGEGKVPAARRPVEGRETVVGMSERFLAGVDFTVTEVNGAPALIAWAGGTLLGVVAFEYRGGAIAAVRAVVNPGKLDFVRRQLTRPQGSRGRPVTSRGGCAVVVGEGRSVREGPPSEGTETA